MPTLEEWAELTVRKGEAWAEALHGGRVRWEVRLCAEGPAPGSSLWPVPGETIARCETEEEALRVAKVCLRLEPRVARFRVVPVVIEVEDG